MSGQQIGTLVGGVIGAYFGGPAGFQYGAAIGGFIGGVVDPTKIQGPHIGDGSDQSSAEGVPIPWILGTAVTAGNIVQKSDRREVKKEDNGKGGPVQVTYEAHQDFAIMICESSETRNSVMLGVSMVRRDGKIVYDTRPGKDFGADNTKFLENCTFYDGAETQLPDPTLEAITGVGNTPAYRGVYLAVFRDINLTEFGDRIPNYEFTMVSEGESVTPGNGYAVGRLGEFTNSHDPRVDGEDAYQYTAYWLDGSAGGHFTPTFDSVSDLQAYMSVQDYGGGAGQHGSPDIYVGYMGISSSDAGDSSGGTDKVDIIDDAQPGVTDLESVLMLYQYHDPAAWNDVATSALCALTTIGGPFQGSYSGTIVKKRVGASDPGFYSTEYCGGSDFTVGIYPVCVSVTRKAIAPSTVPDDWVPIPDAPGYYVLPDGTIQSAPTYSPATGTFKQLAIAHTTSPFSDPVDVYDIYPQGPVLINTDPDYSNATFWTDAYDAAVLSGDLPGGWSYGIQYPVMVSSAFLGTSPGETLNNDSISVADAITRISERGGLVAGQIDVTEVDQTLLGYAITSDYTADDCIRPLLTAYSLYGSEYDAKIRFRKRGANVDITIAPNDLIADSEETDQATRNQAVEYPRKLLLNYIDIDQDFTARTQPRQSLTPDIRAVGEQTLQVSIVMDVDQAAQLADVLYKQIRANVVGTRKFSLPYGTDWACYLALTCGEPVGFDGKRYTITSIGLEPGQLNIELNYDRQSAWTSDVTGIPALPPTPPPSSINGPTILAVMNLPILADRYDKLGMFVAAAGLLTSWRGCYVQMSRDGGATWITVIESLTEQATIGNLLDTIPAAAYETIDYINTLHVQVYGGELDSITLEQLIGEANPAALVHPSGLAEIVQFQTANDLGGGEYELSTLTRGRLNTTPAIHYLSSRFVELDSVYFVELTSADIGRVLKFRAVAFGSLPDSNPTISVTYTPAVIQTEWAPYTLRDTRDGSDNVNLTWIGRGRLGSSLAPYNSSYFNNYRLTFTSGGTSVVKTTTDQFYYYSAAQQAIDFGSTPVSLDVSIVAMNRITGPSIALTGTV